MILMQQMKPCVANGRLTLLISFIFFLLLTACGSDETTTPTYTIGGMVSGLEGSGLVLQNNGGDDLSVNTDGSFTFSTALNDKNTYAVTVLAQPNFPSQTCTVSNGIGIVNAVNVSDILVICSTDPLTIGPNVGQIAPDFTLLDTLRNPVLMSSELVGTDAVVLYFTMWSPISVSHMDHMQTQIIPSHPNVKFFFIDYVSGTVELSRAAQVSAGFIDLTVLSDNTQAVLTLYQATMGTTVVIDSAGFVRMNEDYKDGSILSNTLTSL